MSNKFIERNADTYETVNPTNSLAKNMTETQKAKLKMQLNNRKRSVMSPRMNPVLIPSLAPIHYDSFLDKLKLSK